MYHDTNRVTSDSTRMEPGAFKIADVNNASELALPSRAEDNLEVIDLTSSEDEDVTRERNTESINPVDANNELRVEKEEQITHFEELTDNEEDTNDEANTEVEIPIQEVKAFDITAKEAKISLEEPPREVPDYEEPPTEVPDYEEVSEKAAQGSQDPEIINELDDDPEEEYSIEELSEDPEAKISVGELGEPGDHDQNLEQDEENATNEQDTKEINIQDSKDKSTIEDEAKDEDDDDYHLDVPSKADKDEVVSLNSDRIESDSSVDKRIESFQSFKEQESLTKENKEESSSTETKSSEEEAIEANLHTSNASVSENGLSLEVIPMPIFICIKGDDYLLVPFYKKTELDLEGTVALFDDKEALAFSIEDFFASLRNNEDLADIYGFEEKDELTLKVPELDSLFITEDNIYSRDIGIWDFVKAFITLKINSTERSAPPKLTIDISTQERFITKFNKLTEYIHTGKGFKEIGVVLNEPKIGEKHKLEDDDDSHYDKKRKSKITI